MTEIDVGTDKVRATVEDGVGVLTIDRPEKMNAFTTAVLQGLTAGMDAFETDESVRAVLLTGAGDDAFCAGVDLGGDEEIIASEADLLDSVENAQAVLRSLRDSPLPVVAAINGYAFGAGLDIALGADLRVVRADTQLSESYVKIGLVPGDGGAHMLPRLVGEARAKELVLTGRRVSGTEAADIGLAVEAVDGSAQDTRDVGNDLAHDLATGASVAIGRAKSMIHASATRDLEASLALARDGIRECYATDDYKHAVRAFNEGREPEFEGR
jgi:enoyl-CoA hydratase/carnithine racemase